MISGLSMTIFMAGIVVGSPIAGYVSSHWNPRINLFLSGALCAFAAIGASIWLATRLRSPEIERKCVRYRLPGTANRDTEIAKSELGSPRR